MFNLRSQKLNQNDRFFGPKEIRHHADNHQIEFLDLVASEYRQCFAFHSRLDLRKRKYLRISRKKGGRKKTGGNQRKKNGEKQSADKSDRHQRPALHIIHKHLPTMIRGPLAGINSVCGFSKGTTRMRASGNQASMVCAVWCPVGSRFGRNAASRPTAGRNEQTVYTKLMLVASANSPRTAAPSPAIPKANPKHRPEIIPTLPGTNSCA